MDWLSPSSYWHALSPQPPAGYPPVPGNLEADVVIVGGGITGLTTAMHLTRSGRKVVVLEAGRIGAGTTGGTSGHLDAHPEQGAKTLLDDFGEAAARSVTLARMAAIEQIEEWCTELEIDCDFRRVPAFTYSESPEGAKRLQEECDLLVRLGLDAQPVPRVELPFAHHGGCRIEQQARFDALRYVRALAERVSSEGCTIYEQTAVRPPEEGEPCTLETPRGTVSADVVILCTHSAFLGISQIDMRIAPYQSYVLTARVDAPLPDALFWDDAQPYHYIRLASSSDPQLLVVGGEDHKTGQGEDEREPLARLERYVRDRFAVRGVEQRWSAELFEPADGLPFIGAVPIAKHLYLGAGFSGTGLTFGTVAGKVLAELVQGEESPLAEIFSLSRVNLLAEAGEFLTENLDVARRFVTDRFAGEQIDSFAEIAPGEGRLVHSNGKQWAVYRDGENMLHVLSPVCTHAGCHVQWNEAERTWDCPCHGGRYSPQGERLYGPPPRDLERQSIEATGIPVKEPVGQRAAAGDR